MPHPRRPIRPEDCYRFRNIAEHQISPDGKWVACVISSPQRDRDDPRADLWLFPTDGKRRRKLTDRLHCDRNPCWSPDSRRLVLVAPEKRGGANQLWVISIAGGKARPITQGRLGPQSPAWSPDGKSIAFVAREPKPEKVKPVAMKRGRAYASDVKVIETLRYRSEALNFGQECRHLFVVSAAGGKPRQLTTGKCDDQEPVWSPDGRRLAFLSDRGREIGFDYVNDVWVVPATGGKPRRVTRLPGGAASPSWSPDGRQLAFVGSAEERVAWINMQLWRQSVRGGELVCLTRSLDAVPHSPRWSADGAGVYFLCDDEGYVSLWRARCDGQVTRALPKERCLLGYSVARANGDIAFVHHSPDSPGELFVCAADGAGERQLSHENRATLSRLRLGATEPFWARAHDGKRLQGWVVKPPGFRPGRKYPLLLMVHGGPYGAYAHQWKFDAQALAARGYVVVYANPRGSTGYGRDFTRAITGNWGLADARDDLAAVDHVIRQGYVDRDCLGVTGGSYGGFMTIWLLATTSRFRAGVALCAVADLENLYYCGDLHKWQEQEVGGTPWERQEEFRRHSPLTHAAQITAPLLLLHAEDDWRVPISGAEMLYAKLKRLGKPVGFVRYLSGGHGFADANPRFTCDALNRRLDWFNEHLRR